MCLTLFCSICSYYEGVYFFDGLYRMAPLTPTVIVIRGFTFHSFCFGVVMNGLYLVWLFVMACFRYLSRQ